MQIILRNLAGWAVCEHALQRPRRAGARDGVTLVELLTVITIITLLIAVLLPALNAARESARGTGCQSNLRQFGVGLQSHAARHKEFCSGAFDWAFDGCVTEYGWVADLVNSEIPVGTMLCPSNPAKVSRVYNDLLLLNSPDSCSGIDPSKFQGTEPQTLPDGSKEDQPCWEIANAPIAAYSAAGDARHILVNEKLFHENYNTNYTASWFLVRGGPRIDNSGNLPAAPSGCTLSNPRYLRSRAATIGPMTLDRVDAAAQPSTFIPMLACGGIVPGETLVASVGDEPQGSLVVESVSGGPILREAVSGGNVASGGALEYPTFNSGAPRDGAIGTGWWATWGVCLQDYRQFGAVHRGACNILFADGSVRSFIDTSKDEFLNNGFPANIGGFGSEKIELPKEEVACGWSLREKAR